MKTTQAGTDSYKALIWIKKYTDVKGVIQQVIRERRNEYLMSVVVLFLQKNKSHEWNT